MFRSLVSIHRLVKVAVPAFQNYEHPLHHTIVRKISDQAKSIEYKKEVDNTLTLRKEFITENNDSIVSNDDISSSSQQLTSSTTKISLETFAPYIAPTFNFAAYVNKSPTLQELVKLGVDLYVWEKKKRVFEYVLKLDFEKDMKPVIRFLHDNGVHADSLGNFLTKNPLIFKEGIDDLQVRINYLESKKFTSEMIGKIISGDPYWLMFSTQRIDRRLGHFQKTFLLNGEETRHLATKLPRLITYSMNHIKEITFAVKEMMGFNESELKQILLLRPKFWMMKHDSLIERFNYVHNEMGISHEQLAKHPGILSSRLHRIQQRHQFLEQFIGQPPDGRSRYDRKSIGYISLDDLVAGNDAEFCCDVAKVSAIGIVPPLAVFLTKDPLVAKYDLSSIGVVALGAAPLGKEVQQDLENLINKARARIGAPPCLIVHGYGLTESTIGVSFDRSGNSKLGTVGTLVPGLNCKIIDLETGKSMGANQRGEIWISGPLIMKGYMNDPKSTSEVIDKDGWLHTGDVGYYDEDGNMFIVDRIKELIKYKGFQVPPAELEAILHTHPCVEDVAVVGIPNEEAGEVPMAVIVKKQGRELTVAEVIRFVADQVSPQKRLRGGVKFVNSIPKTQSGKILRRVLKESLKSKL